MNDERCVRCGNTAKCTVDNEPTCYKCLPVVRTKFSLKGLKESEAAAGVAWYCDAKKLKSCHTCVHYILPTGGCNLENRCHFGVNENWQFAFRGPADRVGVGDTDFQNPGRIAMPPRLPPQKAPASTCGECQLLEADGMCRRFVKSGEYKSATDEACHAIRRKPTPLCAICGKERAKGGESYVVGFCNECINGYFNSPEYRDVTKYQNVEHSRMSYVVRMLIAAGTCPACRKPFDRQTYTVMHPACYDEYTHTPFGKDDEDASIAAWLLSRRAVAPKNVEERVLGVSGSCIITPRGIIDTGKQLVNAESPPHCALCEEVVMESVLCAKHFREFAKVGGSNIDYIRQERRARCVWTNTSHKCVETNDCYECKDYEVKKGEKTMSECSFCHSKLNGEGNYCEHCGKERSAEEKTEELLGGRAKNKYPPVFVKDNVEYVAITRNSYDLRNSLILSKDDRIRELEASLRERAGEAQNAKVSLHEKIMAYDRLLAESRLAGKRRWVPRKQHSPKPEKIKSLCHTCSLKCKTTIATIATVTCSKYKKREWFRRKAKLPKCNCRDCYNEQCTKCPEMDCAKCDVYDCNQECYAFVSKPPKLPRRKEKLPAKCRRCMKENKLQRENVERCAKDHPDLDCSFKDMKSPKPPSLRRLRREYYSLAKVAKRQEDARKYNVAIAEMKQNLAEGK